MSELERLIKRAKTTKVATTIRLPEDLDEFFNNLAIQLDISKQEAILIAIQEGVKEVDRQLEAEEQENSSFYILNTNKRYDKNDHINMINDGIAAAYYAPWKFNIDKIKQGDTVFLYENGVGIVAYGFGTGEVLKKEKDDNPEECHYQQLQDFTELETPVSAAQVKQILDRNLSFVRTMISIRDGQKILDHLTK
ncbi:MAG: hypothetical protein CMH98_05445 [Oceanospirillaceae bacterium]|nr:hypothetical protein [Oceanospirillaceae bacterium]